MVDMVAGEIVMSAEEMAARWADVTEQERVFAAHRAASGTSAATLALMEEFLGKPPEWIAECLAAAVAALDDVRRTGRLPG
ncbi:hypothetical protein [Amycolatopsis sp. La24]|uniref:hypothetical protein n=1 Tax=Amycolatopsis sp. La24 TaxID=3028304 RepID=UPI0023B05DEF|nr:hypothetical protein [Amycolatopsis sp. La24]